MIIGFDISQTGRNKSGCGFFARSIITAISSIDDRNTYFLYPRFGTTYWESRKSSLRWKLDRTNVRVKSMGQGFSDSRAFWRELTPEKESRAGSPDIIHSNNFSCPRGASLAKIIYTLHDVSFLDLPEYTTEENRLSSLEGAFNASLYADLIVAVSHFSKRRFLEFFPHYPEDRIRVVHLGSRFRRIHPRRRLRATFRGLDSGRFWFTVGTLEPRKNLRGLLAGFARYVKRAAVKYPLAIAGRRGWLEDDLEEFIESLGLKKRVLLLGYVSDAHLAWLYRNCYCFIYPSLYEGFGLPVLEAMTMGSAVISSRAASLPEVGGDAVHYIDPASEEEMASALQLLEWDTQYREELRSRSLEQSEKFSWERSAKEILRIYEEVVLDKQPRPPENPDRSFLPDPGQSGPKRDIPG